MESLREIIDRVLPLLSYDPQAPMLFSSGLFLFLFSAFAFFYGFMRRTPALRIWYVIAFSLYFYYKSSGIYLLLLVGVSVSDFWIGRAIAHVSSRHAQRALVALSIAADLAVLGYFKYTNFFIEITRDLFGAGFLEFQNIFLPVGISFFLFQSLSYTIDIYRGSLKPVDRWGDYLFYLSFFPQLVAGPIVRARDFLVQIRQNPITVSREMFGTGIYLIAIGLFKKAVISDYISLNFVDRIFDDPALYSGMECLAAVYGYALQIYCDFSGYSDMAWHCCWASASRRTSTPPTTRPRSPNSGGGGTSRSRCGSATISTSRWAATARGACAPISTCSSPWFSAGCGTARRSVSYCGGRCTA